MFSCFSFCESLWAQGLHARVLFQTLLLIDANGNDSSRQQARHGFSQLLGLAPSHHHKLNQSYQLHCIICLPACSSVHMPHVAPDRL